MVAYTFYEADNRVRRYAETLVRRGDEVDAIVVGREGQPSFEVIKGVRVYRVQKRAIDETGPFSYLKKLLMFFLRSALWLTVRHIKARYDIIHVHSVPDFEVFATIPARLMRARVILDIHDIVPEFYASKFKVSERSLVFRALLLMEKLAIAYVNHVIIANHLWYAKLVRRSVQPKKCTTIINYPDPMIFSRRKKSTKENNDIIVCYPGTLNRHQGVDVAINAIALLRDKMPNLKFLIIGDGPERQKLKALVVQQSIEGRVSLVGFVPMEQVAEVMDTIDIGVVPKRKDSFGNEAFSTKIMEFMAMGVPVIASRTHIDEYYFGGGVVQFFESDNAEDLADKIVKLAQDPVRYNALCERATAFVQQNNWEMKKGEYLDLVDRLVKFQEPARRSRRAEAR